MKPFLYMLFLFLCLPAAAQVVFSKAGYPGAPVTRTVAAADLNGDGFADLAMANNFWNPTPENGVMVLLNKGNGTFNGGVVYLPGSQTEDLDIGDLNGDGHPDLAAAIDTDDPVTGKLVLLLNNGSGSFSVAGEYTLSHTPLSVRIGDFNNDGKADVAVGDGTATVSVLLNNGNGTLAAPVNYVATGSRQLAVADLNNDGRADLAVTGGGSNQVSVLLNNGNGTFGNATSYPTGNYAHYIAVADVDGNGQKDLVVSNRGDGTVSVLRNNGNGTFGAQAVYKAGKDPATVAVGDLDGDGKADIAVANISENTLSVLTGNGNGTFRTGYSSGLMSHTLALALADFNGDNRLDLATATDFNAKHLWVWLNAGSYTPNAANILYVNQAVDQMATGYTGNGSSWANAIPDLADALQWAAAQKSSWTTNAPLKIYVAKGRYLPRYTPEDGHTDPANPADSRDRAFLLVPNVKLYGGFNPAGGITDPWQARIFDAGGSILSGDFNNNDVVSGSGASLNITNNNENAYHVVVAASNSGSAGMDGFTISGGNTHTAEDLTVAVNARAVYKNSGGGMYCISASPLLTQLTIEHNVASDKGGGIFICDGAQPIFTNSRINSNSASYGGGIANQQVIAPVFRNLAITNNKAGNSGGGVFSYFAAAPVFTNVTVSSNSAAAGGGLYSRTRSVPSVYNSIIWGNQKGGDAAIAGADIENTPDGSTVGLKNSITQVYTTGNAADNNLTGINPLFANTANGQYTLQSSSPAQNTGSNALYTAAGGTISSDRDLAGNIRLSGNAIDMGAYESQTVLPVSFGAFTAVIKDGRLLVNWSTETETNNDHFLIQLSVDGAQWKTVQTIQSKATGGNSNTTLEYSSTLPLTAAGVSAGLLLLGLMASGRKKKKTLIMVSALACALAFSCSKRDIAKSIENGKLFVRIVQVDKDGTQQVSKVIQAVHD